VQATGRPGAWRCRWLGVLTCGHIWTCPVCSTKLRMRRSQRVMHALKVAGGRWQMVTLTVRHHDGMPLRTLFRGLMRAWRAVRQGGAIQRVWTTNVTASVRSTEVTRSSSGWHPHLHVLLRTGAWSDEERDALLARWIVMVERELGPACVPSLEHAIRWSTPIDACNASERDRARYVAGLGLEIVGVAKRGRAGSWSSWQIAEAAARGDARAQDWWREFARATKGRRALELDDRASRYAKTTLLDDVDDALKPQPDETVVVTSIDSLELGALRDYERRYDPGVLRAMLEAVERAPDPAEAVRIFLSLVTSRLARGYARQNGQRARASPHPDTS